MTIGENLRQLRLQKGLTQEQAAAKLHITRQALSSYESQRTQPDIHMLLALAEVYETDLDGILYGQETSLKNLRRLRTLALWLLALLTGLSILSAAFLWSANAFFPLTGGQLEQMETAVAIHFRLTDAWKTLDGFILLLSNLGFLGLLLLKQMGKCNLSLGRRVAYMGALAGGTMLPGLVFSLFDPVYAFINYGITPLFLWARMLLFFIIDLAVDRFRKRKKAA